MKKKSKIITSFRQYREQFFPKNPNSEDENDPYEIGQQLAQKVLDEADLSGITGQKSSENASSN